MLPSPAMNPRPSLLLSLLAGALGMAVILGAWHLWVDHTNLHALYDLEIRRAQAQAAQAPPPSAGGS